MKKTFLLILLVVTLFFAIRPKEQGHKLSIAEHRKLTHKLPVPDVKDIEVEQTVSITQSSIKKSEVNERDKKKLIQSVLKIEDFNKVNEAVKEAFLEKTKQYNTVEKFSKIENYIEKFDFDGELEKELSKLDEDDLNTILEIDGHPIEEKLKAQEKANEKIIEQALKGDIEYANDPEKQTVIDHIVEESNAVESTQLFFKNVLESTYYNAIKKGNPNLNIAEVRAKAQELTQDKLTQNTGLIKNVFDISYGSMSKDDLEDYYHFLQQRNAKRATSLTINAHNKVMRRFIRGLYNL